ncbi:MULTISPECIES: hypothetical protein [Streptomyces]|uniref:hypothetical protein n=1 Tax=Streptomyces TaxID=1883 RepID=UPI0027DADBDB|nr:hypothetical protein [Streptomyces sp. 9-7]
MRFHDLRHPGNTLPATGGATTRELLHRLGDSSARTTLIYQHLINGRDQAIADHADDQATRER